MRCRDKPATTCFSSPFESVRRLSGTASGRCLTATAQASTAPRPRRGSEPSRQRVAGRPFSPRRARSRPTPTSPRGSCPSSGTQATCATSRACAIRFTSTGHSQVSSSSTGARSPATPTPVSSAAPCLRSRSPPPSILLPPAGRSPCGRSGRSGVITSTGSKGRAQRGSTC